MRIKEKGVGFIRITNEEINTDIMCCFIELKQHIMESFPGINKHPYEEPSPFPNF